MTSVMYIHIILVKLILINPISKMKILNYTFLIPFF